MTKSNLPRVLTVDDGEQIIRRGIKNTLSFVFSDNIDDWISSSQKKQNLTAYSRVTKNKNYKQKHG